MAIAPALHGRGLGSFALAQVAARARDGAFEAVRCDVLEANVRLRDFYQRRGYTPYGLRTHSGWLFTCCECAIGPS